MDNRIPLFAAVALVLLTAAAAPAAAQSETNETPETTVVEDSSLTLAELQQPGRVFPNAPPSMRALGDSGSAVIRWEPPGLIGPPGPRDWKYLEPPEEITTNRVTMRTARFRPTDETIRVHVAGWDRATRQSTGQNGTTTSEPVAANVTEQVVEVSLSNRYDNAEIPLPESYGDAQQVTMWVEGNPDARWRFKHRSIATSRAVDIDTEMDLLTTVLWRYGVWALGGLLIGGYAGRAHRKRAIVGPQWSMVKWLGLLAIPATAGATFAVAQGAVIATRLPQAIGLATLVLGYALVLEGNDHELDTFLFRRQELEHAKSPRGEDAYDSRFVDHVTKKGIHRAAEEELVLIEKGMLPYLARLWGRLATLDVSDIETHKRGQHSPYTLEIELDPKYDLRDALVHQPPGLHREPLTITRDIERTGWGELTIPNPAVVMPVGGGALVGGFVLDWWLSIPMVGALAGAIVGLPFIYRVSDGGAETEPAPYHFGQAEAMLVAEEQEYSDAKTNEDLRKEAHSERMKTPLQAREMLSEFNDTVSAELAEAEAGISGLGESKPDAGVSDDD